MGKWHPGIFWVYLDNFTVPLSAHCAKYLYLCTDWPETSRTGKFCTIQHCKQPWCPANFRFLLEFALVNSQHKASEEKHLRDESCLQWKWLGLGGTCHSMMACRSKAVVLALLCSESWEGFFLLCACVCPRTWVHTRVHVCVLMCTCEYEWAHWS